MVGSDFSLVFFLLNNQETFSKMTTVLAITEHIFQVISRRLRVNLVGDLFCFKESSNRAQVYDYSTDYTQVSLHYCCRIVIIGLIVSFRIIGKEVKSLN